MKLEGFIFVIIGYLFGCFQSAYIFSSVFRKTDIRTHGSGNPGTTNVFLTQGKNLALLVLFCDLMKTILASILCVLISNKSDSLIVISLACLGVALGHNFPFWLKFKGGKGVAVAVACTLVLDVRIFAVSIVVAGVFAFFTKSVVYGSYTFAVMMYVCAAVFGYEMPVLIAILAQSIMIWALHLKRNRPMQKINDRAV